MRRSNLYQCVNANSEISYAGWLGTVAARYIENGKVAETLPSLEESRHRLAAVAGTSTCHIVQVRSLSLIGFIKLNNNTSIEPRRHLCRWSLGPLQRSHH